MSRKKNYKRYQRTDSGNADLFADLCKNAVRFDHKQQRWLLWNEEKCRWEEDKTGQAREFAKKAAAWRFWFAGNLPNRKDQERDEQKREAKWAIESQSLYRIDAALELAKSAPFIADAGNGWDADPWLFGVANGIVDLRTGPCLTVSGTIVSARREADGDWHVQIALDEEFSSLLNQVNLERQQGYLILEPTCSNRISQADTLEEGVCDNFSQTIFSPDLIGQRVAATGAYVRDREHGWTELHPVTSIVPIQ